MLSVEYYSPLYLHINRPVREHVCACACACVSVCVCVYKVVRNKMRKGDQRGNSKEVSLLVKGKRLGCTTQSPSPSPYLSLSFPPPLTHTHFCTHVNKLII